MTAAAGRAVRFLGVNFAPCDVQSALDWVRQAAREERFTYVVTPNVDHLVMFHDRGQEAWRVAYREALVGCGLCLNDSRILQRLAGLSGIDLPVAPGSDLVRALVDCEKVRSGAIALIGGRAAEADWLRNALPAHRIVHLDPPMGVRDKPDVQEEIAAFVEDARADLVLFAIGAPQSEIVAHRIARRGKARGVGLCIGASVEFLSGSKRRAPRIMQRVGLEWLFRLLSEPARLWRRYLVKGPRIFAIWWRERG